MFALTEDCKSFGLFFSGRFLHSTVIDYDSVNGALKLKKKCNIYEDIPQIVMSPGVPVIVALCGLLALKRCICSEFASS